MHKIFLLLLLLPQFLFATLPEKSAAKSVEDHIAVINMDMMILPGTKGYLENALEKASQSGAKALVVKLDTPGGMLVTSQEMIQSIFNAVIPVIIYVTPAGSTATSAGVFIAMAGHIAAMSPGTSIGAAHPVAGDGKDIEGDMRKKAENMTVAMVKSISEERGRNVEWAEKAVTESDSLTEKEALKKNVVDVIAVDIPELLQKIAGKKIKLKDQEVVLEDLSKLPLINYEIDLRNKVLNFLSNPNIAALLWLGATSGLSLELYNPGAILPGVVGVICLILALAVMQILPVTQTGILLIVAGAVMIGAEMFIPSGIFAIGGIIALVLGSIYLIDPVQAPGLSVNLALIIPIATGIGLVMAILAYNIFKLQKSKATTASQGMIGEKCTATADFTKKQTVEVKGEIWQAKLTDGEVEEVTKGTILEVTGMGEGMVLEVQKFGK